MIVLNITLDRFAGYKNFMLSVHCHMAKSPDVRYFNDSENLGLWRPEPPRGQQTRLTSSDLASLAVQAPYLLMLSKRQGSHSSRMTPAGDELPGVKMLLRISLYSAWWRKLRGAESDERKSHQNQALAFALFGGAGNNSAHTTRVQLLDAVVQANQSKFTPEMRAFVHRTGTTGFSKNWTSMELKTMALSNGTLDRSLIPMWMQSLIDKEAVERKKMVTPFSQLSSPVGTPRTFRVRFQPSERSGETTPRALARFPWKQFDKEMVQLPLQDVNAILCRNFPKRNRVLVPAQDLNAHAEFTGWSYPEFEATSRAKYDFDKIRDFDAAGLPRKGGGRAVVASQPGVFARSFARLNQRDFCTAELDNFQVTLTLVVTC